LEYVCSSRDIPAGSEEREASGDRNMYAGVGTSQQSQQEVRSEKLDGQAN
jgi:hypothetical protein